MPVLRDSIKPIHDIFSIAKPNTCDITRLQSKKIDHFSYVGLVLIQDLKLEFIGEEGQ